MPTIVEIPGVGEVEFPDSMSDEQINAAAKNLYDQTQGAAPIPVAQARPGEIPGDTQLPGWSGGLDASVGAGMRAVAGTDLARWVGGGLANAVRGTVQNARGAFDAAKAFAADPSLRGGYDALAAHSPMAILKPVGDDHVREVGTEFARQKEAEMQQMTGQTELPAHIYAALRAAGMGYLGNFEDASDETLNAARLNPGMDKRLFASHILGNLIDIIPAAGLTPSGAKTYTGPKPPADIGTRAVAGAGKFLQDAGQIMAGTHNAPRLPSGPGGQAGADFMAARAGKVPAKPIEGQVALGQATAIREGFPDLHPLNKVPTDRLARTSFGEIPGGIEAHRNLRSARADAKNVKDRARNERRSRLIRNSEGIDRKLEELHKRGAFRDLEDFHIYGELPASAKTGTPEEIIARIRDKRDENLWSEDYIPVRRDEHGSPVGLESPLERSQNFAQRVADEAARRKALEERDFMERPDGDQAFRSLSEEALRKIEGDSVNPVSVRDTALNAGAGRYSRSLDVKARKKALAEKKGSEAPPPPDQPPPPPGGGTGAAEVTGEMSVADLEAAANMPNSLDDLINGPDGTDPIAYQPPRRFPPKGPKGAKATPGKALSSSAKVAKAAKEAADAEISKALTPEAAVEQAHKALEKEHPSTPEGVVAKVHAELERRRLASEANAVGQKIREGQGTTNPRGLLGEDTGLEFSRRKPLTSEQQAEAFKMLDDQGKFNAIFGLPIEPGEIASIVKRLNRKFLRGGKTKWDDLSALGKATNIPRGIIRTAANKLEKGTREGIPGELRRIGEVAFKQTKDQQRTESRFLGTRSQVAYEGIADRLKLENDTIPDKLEQRAVNLYQRGQKAKALALLDKFPATRALIEDQFEALKSGQSELIEILRKRGRISDHKLAATIEANYEKWIHRTYSEAPPTKVVIDRAKKIFAKTRVGWDTVNKRLTILDHENKPWFVLDGRNARKPKLVHVSEAVRTGLIQKQGQIDKVRGAGLRPLKDQPRSQPLTGALQSEADKMFDLFVGRVQAGKDYLLAPTIGKKGGTPQTSALKKRVLDDQLVRLLRGQQKNLGVVNNSVVKLKLLNNTLKFLDNIGNNVDKWAKQSPDSLVKVPDYHLLGPKLEGAMVPRHVADMIGENFGWTGKGSSGEFGAGDYKMIAGFNKVMRFFKFKNTVLNVSGQSTQAGQNFFNLWLAGNSPLNPMNAKAHELARQNWLGKGEKLMTPEGKWVFDALRESGVLEGASIADYSGGMKRLLDRATKGGGMSTWAGLVHKVNQVNLKASDMYNFWDQHAKMSTYIKARGLDGGKGIAVDNWTKVRKLSHDEAVSYVNDFFINYQRPSKLISFIRRAPSLQLLVNPFISSKLLSYPIWGRAIARRPANVLGLLYILHELPDAWWTLSGLSEGKGIGEVEGEIEERRSMLPYDRRFPSRYEVSGPSLTDAPMTYGLDKFWPAFEMLSLLKVGKDPTENVLSEGLMAFGDVLGDQFLSGPLASSIHGKYAMRFQPETPPATTIAEKMFELAFPPGMPGSFKFSELFKATTGANLPSPFPSPSSDIGTKRSVARAAVSIFPGVRTTSFDAALLMRKMGQLRGEDADLDRALNRIERELAGGKIDNQQAIYMIKRLAEKTKALAKKAPK